MSIGRNDLCHCGSGKKYKKCHGSALFHPWQEAVSPIGFSHPQREMIERTFVAMNEDFDEHRLAGACHLLSGVFYVLLAEQGVSSDLKLGVVRRASDGRDFTHSWNEIDGYVFDVAIRHMLNDDQYPPVFAGIDVSKGEAAPFEYGIGRELDLVGFDVQRTPFSALMDQVPYYTHGGWSIVERVAAKLGFEVDIPTLRTQYARTKRVAAWQNDFASVI